MDHSPVLEGAASCWRVGRAGNAMRRVAFVMQIAHVRDRQVDGGEARRCHGLETYGARRLGGAYDPFMPTQAQWISSPDGTTPLAALTARLISTPRWRGVWMKRPAQRGRRADFAARRSQSEADAQRS